MKKLIPLFALVIAVGFAVGKLRTPKNPAEFDLVGLTPAPSTGVRPPRVAESPLCFECRTLQVLRLNPGVAGGGNVVIGQVVHIHLADGLINDRFHTDPDRLAAIARMGGQTYCRTRDRFQMPMGSTALVPKEP